MGHTSSDEAMRPIYKYTLTDQYDKEYEITGYSERLDGKTLIIETLFDGEMAHPGAKVRQKELQPPDGPMPFFNNGEQLG